jgi:hypothetical protein
LSGIASHRVSGDGRTKRTIWPAGCTVCVHPSRVQIELLRVAKTPYRVLAARFDLGKDAVVRHFKNHVSEERKAELMAGPAQVERLAIAAAEESKSVMEYVGIARSVLFNQFLAAAEANDRRGVVNVADSLLQALRDYARLTGELRQMAGISITQNTLNLTASPEFIALSQGLLQIARAHPEAKADIVALLRRLDEPAAVPGLPGPSGEVIEGDVLQ